MLRGQVRRGRSLHDARGLVGRPAEEGPMFRRRAVVAIFCAAATMLWAVPAASAADPMNESGPMPTGATLAELNSKAAIDRDRAQVKHGKLSAAAFGKAHPTWAEFKLKTTALGDGTITPMATGGVIGMSQTPQKNADHPSWGAFYCGPAQARGYVF
jgi:hypothetical protein